MTHRDRLNQAVKFLREAWPLLEFSDDADEIHSFIEKELAEKYQDVTPDQLEEQKLAGDTLTNTLARLEAINNGPEDSDVCIETSAAIGEAMMRFRAAIDRSGPEYDLVEDDEGYQVSILLGLMHSSAKNPRRSFWADLQRAREMFQDDITVDEPDDDLMCHGWDFDSCKEIFFESDYSDVQDDEIRAWMREASLVGCDCSPIEFLTCHLDNWMEKRKQKEAAL